MNNKISDKISDLSKAVDEALSLAASKKEWFGKQVINGLLLLVILLVFGCLDFATVQLHFERLITLSYWTTVGSKVIAAICAYNIGINFLWETEIKKDLILAQAISLYNKLLPYKDIDFEYFVENIFNPTLKKKAYISHINKRIHRLNRFSRAKDRLLYNSVLEERQEEKKTNRYCIKRQELEDLKSEEFIKNNLDNIFVAGYHPVDASVFELEVDGSSKVDRIKVKGNVAVGKAKASATVVFGIIGFSMFATSIGLDLNQEQFANQMVAFWHYFLKCAADVGIVLWQLTRGMLSTRKIISRELTQVYVGRNKVLQDYIEWRLNTNQPNSKYHDEIKKNIVNEGEEVVELTQEQFDELKRLSM